MLSHFRVSVECPARCQLSLCAHRRYISCTFALQTDGDLKNWDEKKWVLVNGQVVAVTLVLRLGIKADDTQSRFRHRKSAPKIGADFWTVIPIWYQTFLVPDSGAGRVVCSISYRFLVCTWPLWRPVIGRCHCFHFVCIVWWFYCNYTSRCNSIIVNFFASSMITFGADFSY